MNSGQVSGSISESVIEVSAMRNAPSAATIISEIAAVRYCHALGSGSWITEAWSQSLMSGMGGKRMLEERSSSFRPGSPPRTTDRPFAATRL